MVSVVSLTAITDQPPGGDESGPAVVGSDDASLPALTVPPPPSATAPAGHATVAPAIWPGGTSAEIPVTTVTFDGSKLVPGWPGGPAGPSLPRSAWIAAGVSADSGISVP